MRVRASVLASARVCVYVCVCVFVLHTHTHKRFHAKQLLALSSVRSLNLWTRLTARMQELSQRVRQHPYRGKKPFANHVHYSHVEHRL